MTDNQLRKDHDTLRNAFDAHLQIYAKNGKELAAVKTNQAWLMKFFWAFMTPTLGGVGFIIYKLF